MTQQIINLKGYASPRPFSGFQIPVPLQSMTIRRYCDERGLVFNHHVVENVTNGSYLVLERVVSDSHKFQALGMCSIGMLPSDPTHRIFLLNRCLANGTSIHFIFEQVTLTSTTELDAFGELLTLTTMLRNETRHLERVAGLVRNPREG
jgi:sporadic carbohydrate cluster protein (TIGR04323 family)